VSSWVPFRVGRKCGSLIPSANHIAVLIIAMGVTPKRAIFTHHSFQGFSIYLDQSDQSHWTVQIVGNKV
jgi:hypothetical protein